jgi:glycosyltransferase involved in cell wall biosynthesis
MKTYKSAISIASNSPGMPTGYGVQALLVAERLKRDGHDVAALSNFGLEGNISTLETKHGKIKHYPRGYTLYSGDVLKLHHDHFLAGRFIPNAILTLYDAWVYSDVPNIDTLKFWSWTPVDHITVPPKVLAWAKKPNVKTIAMSPFGQSQFELLGVDSTYIPHAIDTSVYRPTEKIGGVGHREYMGIPEDAFLVGMVAANKANGSLHRKAFGENLLAFAIYRKENPNAYLYIHSDPSRIFGGFDLGNLMKAVGLPIDSVLFPDPVKLRYGYTPQEMAGIYSSFDVLLHASYGEGFGVPAIEAQACGTRVIGSNWAATPDLVSEDSWLVEGQPFWDEAQQSFFMIPLIPSIVKALKEANDNRGHSDEAVAFAQKFDADTVWREYWQPFLKANL